MIKLKYLAFTSLGLLILMFFFFVLRSIPIPDERNCVEVAGVVSEIWPGPSFDVLIKLKNREQIFYINRGLENGLDLDNLKNDLIGKKILLKHPKYWTPLDPFNSVRHVSKLDFQGKTVYSEME